MTAESPVVHLTPVTHMEVRPGKRLETRKALFTSGNEGSGAEQMVVLEEGPKEQRLVMSQ